MKLFIPLATGQSIPNQVYVSLSQQTINIDIIPCCTPGVINSNHTQNPDQIAKQIGEVASRNVALDLMEPLDDEFVLMQDRDVIHLDGNNYAAAIEYLKNNPDVGMVSLPWRDNFVSDHIRMQALTIRKAALTNFRFRVNKRPCLCYVVAEDMAKNNWKYLFLPGSKRLIDELR